MRPRLGLRRGSRSRSMPTKEGAVGRGGKAGGVADVGAEPRKAQGEAGRDFDARKGWPFRPAWRP